MIKLLFTAKHQIGSWIIRTGTWSKWSHVALLCSDSNVIEAIGFKGVRKVSLEEALLGSFRHAIVEIVEASPEEEEKLIEILSTQLGKSYDYIGALGIGLHRNWQDDDKWICSELICWGLQQIGKPLFRAEEIRKISQQNLWVRQPEGKTELSES